MLRGLPQPADQTKMRWGRAASCGISPPGLEFEALTYARGLSAASTPGPAQTPVAPACLPHGPRRSHQAVKHVLLGTAGPAGQQKNPLCGTAVRAVSTLTAQQTSGWVEGGRRPDYAEGPRSAPPGSLCLASGPVRRDQLGSASWPHSSHGM